MPKFVNFLEGPAPINLLPLSDFLLPDRYLSQVKGYPESEAYTCKNFDLIYEEIAIAKGGLLSLFVHTENQTKLTLSFQENSYVIILLTRGSIVIDFTEEDSQLLFQWQSIEFKSDGNLDLLFVPGSYEMKIIQMSTLEYTNKQKLNIWPERRRISITPEILINEIRTFEREQPSKTKYEIWFADRFSEIVAVHLQLKALINEYKKPWPIDRLELITTYINQNLLENITDLGLCINYYLTENELEKLFFLHHRCSVRRYITEQRLRIANELFYYDMFDISEIAAKVGYKEVSFFIKDYESHYGNVPSIKGKRKNP